MQSIQSEKQFYDIIAQPQTTMVVFKTTWCKDCHYIEPFMPEIVEQYRDQLHFVQVDRDEFPDLCAEYHVLGIPSFIAFKEGKELVRFVSKLRKTREEIEHFLNRAIEVSNAMQSEMN